MDKKGLPGRKMPLRGKAQGKERRIMEAAERLFTSRRFHEITLEEVAQAAKVGKGTIYLDDLEILTEMPK